jgi:Ca2+-binding RTX toxin-like protein
MSGGANNDIYIVDDAGDQTIELAAEGYDIVRTALDGWVLGDNLEALQLQGSADIDGAGNAGANNLQGNAGANSLDGAAGSDTINGNDGDDTVIGGLGNDLLRGGTGADSFVVAHAFGPVLETDQIYDFSTAEGDIIDLSGAYAGTLELAAGFSKTAGEMTLTFAGGITTLRLDVNGDGKVDYQMKINGDVTGDSGGWIL